MTDHERLSTIQSYAWTLELLGEALVQHDEVLECEHNPHLSFRNTAGIHQAIRIISRLASEQCGKVSLLQDEEGGESRADWESGDRRNAEARLTQPLRFAPVPGYSPATTTDAQRRDAAGDPSFARCGTATPSQSGDPAVSPKANSRPVAQALERS